MEENKNVEQQSSGVVVPPEIVADSMKKKKARRTLRQLPLYRDMANLKYLVASLYNTMPRKMTKYIDGMLSTVSEAKKCVGLGEAAHDAAVRSEYLSMARIFIEDTHDDITILRQLKVLDKNTEKKMKSLAKSIVAQCVAWRDYTNTQGINSEKIYD